MQSILTTSGSWAVDHGLTWGITKCAALAAPGAPQVELLLNVELLSYAPAAEYLGVNLSASGVTDAATLERITKAEVRLRMLQRSGIGRPRIGSERLRTVYAALIGVFDGAHHGMGVPKLTEAVTEAS